MMRTANPPAVLTEAIWTALARHPLFRNLSDETIRSCASQCHFLSVEQSRLMFVQQDPAPCAYLIESGWVKLFRETIDGNEAILDIIPAGQMFGEAALFHNHTYPFSAQMIEGGTLIAIPLTAIDQMVLHEPHFAHNMLAAMARFRRYQDQEIEHRTLQNAPQRIGCFLLRLCDQTQEGGQTLHLPYDKTLIAARLGMQPETFSRALARLREDTGLVIKGADVQIPNLNTLQEYSCNVCSSSYPCYDKI